MRSAATTEHVATTGSPATSQPTTPSAARPSSASSTRAHAAHAAPHGEREDRAARHRLPDRQCQAPGRSAGPLRREHDDRERRPDHPGRPLRRGRAPQDVAQVRRSRHQLQDPREYAEGSLHRGHRRDWQRASAASVPALEALPPASAQAQAAVEERELLAARRARRARRCGRRCPARPRSRRRRRSPGSACGRRPGRARRAGTSAADRATRVRARSPRRRSEPAARRSRRGPAGARGAGRRT